MNWSKVLSQDIATTVRRIQHGKSCGLCGFAVVEKLLELQVSA